MWTFACTLAIVLLDMDKYKNLFPTEELISYFYMYFNIIIDTQNILQFRLANVDNLGLYCMPGKKEPTSNSLQLNGGGECPGGIVLSSRC